MQCDDCIMYEPDENYCRRFKMNASDFDYECTLKVQRLNEQEEEED